MKRYLITAAIAAVSVLALGNTTATLQRLEARTDAAANLVQLLAQSEDAGTAGLSVALERTVSSLGAIADDAAALELDAMDDSAQQLLAGQMSETLAILWVAAGTLEDRGYPELADSARQVLDRYAAIFTGQVRSGRLRFRVPVWSDASGHFDLWDARFEWDASTDGFRVSVWSDASGHFDFVAHWSDASGHFDFWDGRS